MARHKTRWGRNLVTRSFLSPTCRRACRALVSTFMLAAGAVTAWADYPKLALKPISLGQLHSPTVITYAPDNSGRLFVCDQPGRIYIIEFGSLIGTPFLDITATAVGQGTGYSERGLLGLAFHPGYADPESPGYRKFYVNYNKPWVNGSDPNPPVADHTPNCVTVISEFQVSEGDPYVADPTERRLLVFTQPQSNHNGGQLEFGPDGMLYIGTGDGGSSDDNNVGHTGGSGSRPTNGLGNGQDLTNYLGKILRIDPIDPDEEGPLSYSIPEDNPFFQDNTPNLKKEIYAYGLRNPWRFSFDKREGGTGRLFCGDVGQGRIEEVNIIVSGGNYGWRYREGTELPAFSSGAASNPMPHPGGTLIDPIAMYAHPGANVGNPPLPQLGFSITGGFVYRGSLIPGLVGKYIFGDYGTTNGVSDGRMMGLEETAPGSGEFVLNQALPLLGTNPIVGHRILTLGEDEAGELYVGLKTKPGVLELGTDGLPSGGVYKIVPEQTVVATLRPSRDNTIFSEDADPNIDTIRPGFEHASDGRGYIYAGRTGPNYGPFIRRGLVQFDVDFRIPPGSVVTEASLRMNFVKGGANAFGKIVSLHRLNETWGEGTSQEITGKGAPATPNDATWIYRFFDTPAWSTPGGVFEPVASAIATLGNPGLVTWESNAALVADVQRWVDTPAENCGWLLRGNENVDVTAAQFDSDEAGSQPPRLTVRYQTSSPPLTLIVPADITIEADQPGGRNVTYDTSAVDDIGLAYSVEADYPSGSLLPLGTTVVNLLSDNGLGSVSVGTFNVTVQDTTPPQINGTFPTTTSSGLMPDLRGLADATDAVSTPVVTQVPAPGSPIAPGPIQVTIRATDMAGNESSETFTLTRVAFTATHEIRHTSGAPVPGAGGVGGVPQDATFVSFGTPSINDAGDVAFLAKWTSPTGAGSGIFVGNPVALVVKAGDEVPGAAPATFKTLSDPVLNAAGRVAFTATITGGGTTKSTDTVLVTNAFTGALEVPVRESDLLNTTGNPRLKSFRSFSLINGELLFTVVLAGGSPAAKGTTNDAAFRISSSGGTPELVIREGDPFLDSKVKAFRLLDVVKGSPGQGRGHLAGSARFFVQLSNRMQALVQSNGGVLEKIAATNDITGGTVLPDGTFKTFGPLSAASGYSTFAAVLNKLDGGVTAADAAGIFVGTGSTFDPLARQAQPAAPYANAVFKKFSDPVLSATTQSVAFIAMMRGSGVKAANDQAVFYRQSGESLTGIAREGDLPIGGDTGTRWKSFISLVQPGGNTGPVFQAKVAGRGVKTTNDDGVWGTSIDGGVALLFRERGAVGDKILKRFTVLNAVAGGTGVSRAFNSEQQLVWRGDFMDNTSGIVVTTLP